MVKQKQPPRLDSDSDSSDGINMNLLREAADQELINDSMFKDVGSNDQKPTSG